MPSHIVTGIFKDKYRAGHAAEELTRADFTEDIALMEKDGSGEIISEPIKQDVSEGMIGGAIIGTTFGLLSGLLLTFGSPFVQGLFTAFLALLFSALIGMVGLFMGALLGGLVGLFVDRGIGITDSFKRYIRRNEVLVAVTGDHKNERKIKSIFTKNGALTTNIKHKVFAGV